MDGAFRSDQHGGAGLPNQQSCHPAGMGVCSAVGVSVHVPDESQCGGSCPAALRD